MEERRRESCRALGPARPWVRDGSLCRSGSGDLRADGKYSDYPEVLAATFTRFENHEGISSPLYISQRGD
jgi:hypothetical protein